MAKRGCKPQGDRAMTGSERMARLIARKKAAQDRKDAALLKIRDEAQTIREARMIAAQALGLGLPTRSLMQQPSGAAPSTHVVSDRLSPEW